MTGKVDMTLPPDMLMMLGRMDGKLDSLLTQTATNTAELKELGGRVTALENDRAEAHVLRGTFAKVVMDVEELKTAKSEATGSWKGAAWAGQAVKAVGVAAIGALGMVGAQVVFVKKEPAVKAETTIEHRVMAPVAKH